MWKAIVRLLIGMACFVLLLFISLPLLIFTLEYSRVRGLCPAGAARVETAHDAITAIRNYREENGIVGRVLSTVRGYDAFKNNDGSGSYYEDGYRYTAGWHVETRNEPLIGRVYKVAFHYISIEVICDVYDCGGIDIPNCLTMSGTYTPAGTAGDAFTNPATAVRRHSLQDG